MNRTTLSHYMDAYKIISIIFKQSFIISHFGLFFRVIFTNWTHFLLIYLFIYHVTADSRWKPKGKNCFILILMPSWSSLVLWSWENGGGGGGALNILVGHLVAWNENSKHWETVGICSAPTLSGCEWFISHRRALHDAFDLDWLTAIDIYSESISNKTPHQLFDWTPFKHLFFSFSFL